MSRMLEELLSKSGTTGWATVQGHLDQVRLDAKMLGWTTVPIRRGGPTVATLRPLDPADAAPNSLSAHYGKGTQPLHTDGAHLPEPPDIVVLTCETTSTTPTLLWNKVGGVPGFMQHGVFLISSGNDSFFTTAYAQERLRYDPGCMLPCDARAHQTVRFFEEVASTATEYRWSEPGQVLLINNRRVLHARASAAHEPQREIQRVSFHLNREAS